MEADTPRPFLVVIGSSAGGIEALSVLLSGLLRYAFIGASLALPWMRSPLPPRFRRKAIAVVQVTALIVTIAPFVAPSFGELVAASALLALAISFLLDVAWLKRHSTQPGAAPPER